MFQVRNVTKRFGGRPLPVTALRSVDLDAAEGKITALLGPSGSGKTTLLRILAGFDRPDEGEVRLAGDVVAGRGVFVPPERRRVGIVTQEGSLFPHLDVAANIAYGLPGGWQRLWSVRRRRARADRVAELLEMVGLPGYERRRPHELSGGQLQRVALARALAPAPAVLLLDEPFSALDASLRVELREEVCALLRRLATTTVLVTHDQGEALSLADHVVVLRDGRVVQAGEPADLYARPADAATADLLGDVVLLDGELCGAVGGSGPAASCALGTVLVDRAEGSAGAACTLVLRPEQLHLCDAGVSARVLATSYYGHDGMVHLQVDGLADPTMVRTVGELPTVDDAVCVAVVPGTVAHVVETEPPQPVLAGAANPSSRSIMG